MAVHKIFTIGWIILQCMWSFAQVPFPCDGRFILSIANHSRDASSLYIGHLDANQQVQFSEIALDNPEGYNLNGLGFSMRDNLVYGYDPNTYTIFTIDATGKVSSFRNLPEIAEFGYEIAAGEMDRVGNRVMLIGRKGEPAYDEKVFIIRLNRPNDPPDLINVQSDVPVRIDDFAVDPITGVVYGFDAVAKRLITIGLGTTFAVFSHEFTSISGVGQLGAIFFDQAGDLYAYGSTGGTTDSAIFRLDKNSGQVLETFSGPRSGGSTDGCGCPYIIDFNKSVIPQQTVPCGEVIFTYDLINQSGAGRSAIHLRDSFPPGFIITEIESNIFLATVNSGVGTNILDLTNVSAPIGTYPLRVHVQVPEDYLGEVATQAIIDNLPLALGLRQLSNNPLTSALDDVTTFEVLVPNDIQLEDQLSQLCYGDTSTLYAPFLGNTYLWSDGSTERTLQIMKPGLYWLEIIGDCFIYRDSILVEQSLEPLTLDLGEDQELQSGDELQFTYETSASGILSYEWSSTNTALSCYSCPFPTIIPAQAATYHLTIRDEFGCIATDSIYVNVTKSDRFYLANVFSPNDDGINDYFFLQGKVLAMITNFQIYNRWGNLVHEQQGGLINEPAAGWDGRINGQVAENGIYLWKAKIVFPDGSTEILTGDVALVN